ncbi:hypothetical protein QTG54_012021 [Skeletonema marinoi]|uniref:Uncharacterized protein n=1 Tax=Skeletonema marinoi TaxID=267567 RepID=A0AAD8Y074_9STRA|nr:hypothetical protein QTG54_012021 [Skeletonema marinoi]
MKLDTPRRLQLVFIATLVVASGALQCRNPRNNRVSANRHNRLDTSIRSSLTNTEHGIEDNVQVFLRFSPLIGGPPIPLHVEVILAEGDTDKHKDAESKGTIYIRKTNNLASMAVLNTYPQLHRLDFLPENPTDHSTVVRLASLQSVPGKLRHRYVTASSDAKQDGKGITVLLPVGSIPCQKKSGATSSNVISTALDFTNERRDNVYDDLRIFLGKNCLSFALDLLLELNNVHGIQRVDSWNKIDFGE